MGIYTLAVLLGLVYGTFAASLKSPRAATSYIVGGHQAARGQFPYQVGLISNGYLICGGTLTYNYNGDLRVITAAHCMGGKRSVVFGLYDQSDLNENIFIADPSRTVVHRRYSSQTLDNDIAIIHFNPIDYDAILNTGASPIGLVTEQHKDKEVCTVSGWGTTSSGGSTAAILRFVDKPMLSRAACEETMNKGHLTDSMLCAGEEGLDACQGDSGGPLVVNRASVGVPQLAGVVSWGFGCGAENAPGVYANVFHLRSWIEQNW